MAKALFISEKKFKEVSFVGQNLTMDKMKPVFVDVQELDIKPALGTALFNEIALQIVEDSLTPENETLLFEHIQPMMVRLAEAKAMELFSVQFVNKGSVRETGENTQNASMDELRSRVQALKQTGMEYRDRLERFLMANPTVYPLYNNAGNSYDTIYPRQKQYASSMNLEFIPTETNRYGRSNVLWVDDWAKWGCCFRDGGYYV